jgi:hypothetical protein
VRGEECQLVLSLLLLGSDKKGDETCTRVENSTRCKTKTEPSMAYLLALLLRTATIPTSFQSSKPLFEPH